jgi:hypothetical protein
MSDIKVCPFLFVGMMPLGLKDAGPDSPLRCVEAKCAMWRKVLEDVEFVNAKIVSQTWREYCGLAGKI